LKDDRLVAVEEDAVFYVPANGAGQDQFFDVASFLDEVFDGVAMIDADDVLFDDGAIVEHLSNVVGGRSDELDAALKCLVVGFGTDEGREKRMMNVD
jgi:hypothetical protein